MLKNSNRTEGNSHFTYSDYKKKVNKKESSDLKIFASVFFVALLVILGLARCCSPNVDIGISSGDELGADVEDSVSASSIDQRLRSLKLEDEGKKLVEDDMFSPDLDEKVVIPRSKVSAVPDSEPNKILPQSVADPKPTKTEPVQSPQQQPTRVVEQKQVVQPVQSSDVIRVVVGSYANERQAEVAKSIMQEAGLGITPVVKNINGTYTLQVGSYTSREHAQQVTNSLLKSNFPARMIN